MTPSLEGLLPVVQLLVVPLLHLEVCQVLPAPLEQPGGGLLLAELVVDGYERLNDCRMAIQ